MDESPILGETPWKQLAGAGDRSRRLNASDPATQIGSLWKPNKLNFDLGYVDLFNHSNLYVDGANADLSAFNFVPADRGVIPNGGAPIVERRNVQFALKFIF